MEDWTRFVENLGVPPVQKIDAPVLNQKQIHLYVQREDLIHPRLSGNKWHKLKYTAKAALDSNNKTLITFGGAYSNHIAATAEAGAIFGLPTIGIIRGEEEVVNPTLEKASGLGMKLIYVSRAAYRDKEQLVRELDLDLSQSIVIPEGGTNENALEGCKDIILKSPITTGIDYWCVACGTGGTAAGMISALKGQSHLLGFSVLKGNWMEQEVKSLSAARSGSANNNWSVNTDFHFGGYAKFNIELIDFINAFKRDHGIRLEPVYTGKLFYGLFELIRQDYFTPGTSIAAIHTGGLQGLKGFNQRHGPLID